MKPLKDWKPLTNIYMIEGYEAAKAGCIKDANPHAEQQLSFSWRMGFDRYVEEQRRLKLLEALSALDQELGLYDPPYNTPL